VKPSEWPYRLYDSTSSRVVRRSRLDGTSTETTVVLLEAGFGLRGRCDGKNSHGELSRNSDCRPKKLWQVAQPTGGWGRGAIGKSEEIHRSGHAQLLVVERLLGISEEEDGGELQNWCRGRRSCTKVTGGNATVEGTAEPERGRELNVCAQRPCHGFSLVYKPPRKVLGRLQQAFVGKGCEITTSTYKYSPCAMTPSQPLKRRAITGAFLSSLLPSI
jgi:hypothetical protein